MESVAYFSADRYKAKDQNKRDFDNDELSIMKELFLNALWENNYEKPKAKLRIRKTEDMTFLSLEGRGKLKGEVLWYFGVTDDGRSEYEIHRNIYYEFIRSVLALHIQREIKAAESKKKEDKP